MSEYAPPHAAPQPLSPASPLGAAMQAYHACLAGSSYSAPTVKAFIHVIALLASFLGLSRPIGEVADRCISLQRL